MWTVVWPILNSSPSGMHRVATGVDDSPKLAHQGHVQLGVRELTILASCSQDIVGRKLGAAASPILSQCTAATCGQNAGHHVFLLDMARFGRWCDRKWHNFSLLLRSFIPSRVHTDNSKHISAYAGWYLPYALLLALFLQRRF